MKEHQLRFGLNLSQYPDGKMPNRSLNDIKHAQLNGRFYLTIKSMMLVVIVSVIYLRDKTNANRNALEYLCLNSTSLLRRTVQTSAMSN